MSCVHVHVDGLACCHSLHPAYESLSECANDTQSCADGFQNLGQNIDSRLNAGDELLPSWPCWDA